MVMAGLFLLQAATLVAIIGTAVAAAQVVKLIARVVLR